MGLSYQPDWQQLQLNGREMVIKVASEKLGGFLLLLGIAHLFNLLLLAIFRRRGAAQSGTAA